MTPKEIQEGNKLIAEFMGVTFNSAFSQWQFSPGKFYKNLEYHFSWDWLMPVVGKVESFGHSVSIFRGCCDIRFDGIKDGEEPDPIESGGGQPKIVSVFQSMVKFIQWYNAQKSNP